MDNRAADALESATELHRLARRQGDGFVIHIRKRVIHDKARSPIPLGDDSKWGDAQVRQMADSVVRHHHPIPLTTKIEHLLTNKLALALRGLMRSALHCLVASPLVPRWRGCWNARTASPQMFQQSCCLVGNSTNRINNIGAPTNILDHNVPSALCNVECRGRGQLTKSCLRVRDLFGWSFAAASSHRQPTIRLG